MLWYVSSHVHSFHKHFYEVDNTRFDGEKYSDEDQFSDENDAVDKLIQDTGNILWLYYNSAISPLH